MSTATSSPSKEKVCSLLSDIIDRSKDIIVETEEALNFDAVELTLLLKSLGFQLSSLDFDNSPNEDIKEIEVEIRCKQSGIRSRLSMVSSNCTCPLRKAINNNSFWEVQGRAPSTPDNKKSGIVQDTSSNLLPEISKKTLNLGKTMLTVLLQHYQAEFDQKAENIKTIDVKQLIERLGERSTSLEEKPTYTERNKNAQNSHSMPTVIPTLLVEQNFISPIENGSITKLPNFLTPLSSINVTPVPSYDNIDLITPENMFCIQENIPDGNEKPLEGSPFTCSSIEDCGPPSIQNTTFEKLSPANDKDICLMQIIHDARRQLDKAMQMLKCDAGRCSSTESFVLPTPREAQLTGKSPALLKGNRLSLLSVKSGNKFDVNRRHSSGPRLDGKENQTTLKKSAKISASSTALNDNRRKSFGFPPPPKIQIKLDTPRPPVIGRKEAEKTHSNFKAPSKNSAVLKFPQKQKPPNTQNSLGSSKKI